MRFHLTIVTILAFALCLTTTLGAEPTTRPAEERPRPGPAGGGRGEMLFGRFREAIADLNLTDEQKAKIKDIFDDAKEKLTAMEPQERQQKFRGAMMDLREKLTAVLTEEQAGKLREKLERGRGPGGRPGAPPRSDPPEQMNQPANTGTQVGVRTGEMMERLNAAIEHLELSGEQKTQIQSIVDEGKQQLTELRSKFQSGQVQADAARTESQRIFAEIRDQLSGVLSKDQQQKLRDEIQRARERENTVASASKPPTDAPDMNPPPAPKPDGMKPEMKADPFAPQAPRNTAGDNAAAPTPQVAAPARDAGAKINEVAPEFTLERLDGRNASLSAFKGKPLVIEFGSYSSPSFRQRAAKMEDLAKQYSMRANFLVIYTKEAHPIGGWEVDRNKDDRIAIPPHADLAARKSAAKDAKQALKLTLPIAVDGMDDKIAAAYGASENSAVVIGRDGKVLSKQTWADPYRLRAALDEALKTSTTAPVE